MVMGLCHISSRFFSQCGKLIASLSAKLSIIGETFLNPRFQQFPLSFSQLNWLHAESLAEQRGVI